MVFSPPGGIIFRRLRPFYAGEDFQNLGSPPCRWIFKQVCREGQGCQALTNPLCSVFRPENSVLDAIFLFVSQQLKNKFQDHCRIWWLGFFSVHLNSCPGLQIPVRYLLQNVYLILILVLLVLKGRLPIKRMSELYYLKPISSSQQWQLDYEV